MNQNERLAEAVSALQKEIDSGDPDRASIGVGSAFASSTALLTAFIPLASPLLATSSLSAYGTVAALAIAATVVDVSPFSTDGALVVPTPARRTGSAFTGS